MPSPLNIRIFILCHDDISQEKAFLEFGHHEWATVLRIETTLYLENIMYSSVLMKHKALWEDCDYVGTLAWCARQKVLIPDMDLIRSKIEPLLEAGQACDVVSFANYPKILLQDAQVNHPLFVPIWTALLTEMGYEKADILSTKIFAFYCNYWMARPSWMLAYIEFFGRAKHLLDTYEPIQAALWSDAEYDSGALSDKMKRAFGRPYYPYHTFICERLPCFFFWKHGATVRPTGLTQPRRRIHITGQ
jgi:hypothetical protein